MSRERRREPREPEGTESFEIDCATCAMRDTDACRGCVVTYVIDRPEGAVVFDAAEERAIRTMAREGLLPEVRWEPRREETG